jgi:HD-GYP domain-containing protein (c-di-GMP phosphodiesterase class II)
MNLVPVDIATIRLGQPLPFELRTERGVLLAQRGYVIHSRDEITYWTSRGMTLCVDMDASDDRQRAYVGKLHTMLRSERPLGEIQKVQIAPDDLFAKATLPDKPDRPDWPALQARAHALLRDVRSEGFLTRLDKLYDELKGLARHHPDATLFALNHLSATELRMYSATHAMLVYVVCSLAARHVLQWPDDMDETLGKAALTMNISMTVLQDQLAVQAQALSSEQIEAVEQHPQRSFATLLELGVTDEQWLLAVRHHHDRAPGPLADKAPAQRIARLIQRADVFTSRLAPRVSRTPMSTSAAMQACYFDEEHQVDEGGAALIKAVGVYSPGLYVRLASNELAVVIQRGKNTSTPRVAVVVNRDGLPTGEMSIRDTSQPAYKITASVPHREVKVQVALDRVLALI